MMRIFLIFMILTASISVKSQTKAHIDSVLNKYSSDITLNSDFANFFKNNQQAYEQSTKLGYKKGIGQSASNLSVVFFNQQDFAKSFKYAFEAEKIALELKDSTLLIESKHNIATLYYETGDFEKALKLHNEYFKIANLKKDYNSAGNAIYSAGVIKFEQGYTEEALKLLHKSIPLYLLANNAKEINLPFVYFQIGVAHHYALKKLDSAVFYYNKTMNLAKETNNNTLIGVTSMVLSDIYKNNGDLNKAEKELYLALEKMKEFKNYNFMNQIYNRLSFISVSKKDFKQAYNNLLEAYNLKDSVSSAEKTKEVTTLKLNSEFDKEKEVMALKKKQEQEILNEKINSEKRQKIYSYIGAFLLLIVVLVVFRSYRFAKKSNAVISLQKEKIEEQHKEITDSIKYAQGIQQSILPIIPNVYSNSTLIMYKPKDVVSGDFYWFKETSDKVFIAVADCTGHGVPGAMMSMINHDLLEMAAKKCNNPGDILTYVNKKLSERMSVLGRQDGMDISIISIQKGNGQVLYAGAKRNVYIVKNGELTEVLADKFSIGGNTNSEYEFSTRILNTQVGDMIYMTTDGYIDQFGGEKDKKLGTSRFKQLLCSISSKHVSEQKIDLEKSFDSWKGNTEQTDDVCVIGVRM